MRGFLPASLVDIRRVQDLDEFLGRKLECKVIELNRNRNNVVLSRRAVLEDERREVRQKILDELQPGQVVEGVISNIVEFGAFVDLDGIDGLIHISELSWSHVNHPSEVLPIGEKVKVKVLDIDRDRQRISLGLKQTQADPWQSVIESYQVNDVVEGRVTKVVTFGAFVEIHPGVEGLVHISELAAHHVENPREVVNQGDVLAVRVIEIDADRRRLSLSLKRVADSDAIQHHLPDEIRDAGDRRRGRGRLRRERPGRRRRRRGRDGAEATAAEDAVAEGARGGRRRRPRPRRRPRRPSPRPREELARARRPSPRPRSEEACAEASRRSAERGRGAPRPEEPAEDDGRRGAADEVPVAPRRAGGRRPDRELTGARGAPRRRPSAIGPDRRDRVGQVRGARGVRAAAARPSLSSDAVVHAALRASPRCVAAVPARFGAGVARAPTARSTAALLGARAFAEEGGHRRSSRRCCTPRVEAPPAGLDRASSAALDPPPPLLVCEVPLLFEAGAEEAFDAVLVVTRRRGGAPGPGRGARAGLRRARRRQLPEAEKVARADRCVRQRRVDLEDLRGLGRRPVRGVRWPAL